MLSLIYDPAQVADPQPIAETLGIGHLVVRPNFPIDPPGWCVVRETWAGEDILYPPVTPADIGNLPDHGEHPALRKRRVRESIEEAFGDYDEPIDVAALKRDLAALKQNPTLAVVARVQANLIRYLLVRGRA